VYGAGSYENFRSRHKGWVAEYLGAGKKDRQQKLSCSIAVGGKPFVEKVKRLLGFRARGSKISKIGEGYRIRETTARYNEFFGVKKADIEPENAYCWSINTD